MRHPFQAAQNAAHFPRIPPPRRRTPARLIPAHLWPVGLKKIYAPEQTCLRSQCEPSLERLSFPDQVQSHENARRSVSGRHSGAR